MKKPIYVFVVLALALFNCATDELDKDLELENLDTVINIDDQDVSDYSRTTNQSTQDFQSELDNLLTSDACYKAALLQEDGSLTGYVLITAFDKEVDFSFRTVSEWRMVETNLNLGDCSANSFPMNENGSMIPGEFAYSFVDKNGMNEKTYKFLKSEIDNAKCFAAHAIIVNDRGDEKEVWAQEWEAFTQIDINSCDTASNSNSTTEITKCFTASDMEFFIPLTPEMSGKYPNAGNQADSASLSSDNPTSQGQLEFEIDFVGIPKEYKNVSLSISFYDLDLHHDLISSNGRVIEFYETMTIRNDKGEVLAMLDENFEQDGEFILELPLADNMFTGGAKMTLYATLDANLELLSGNSVTVTNTVEEMFDITMCGTTPKIEE